MTRHKVGCDKRFKPERNQEPPHDFEPPAKIPKPPQHYNQRGAMLPGTSLLNSKQIANQKLLNQAAARAALQQFNQQQRAKNSSNHNMYSQMPALQFGPGGRGRGTNFGKPFVPNQRPNQPHQRQQMNFPNAGQVRRLPNAGQVGRLPGNPSVTIQVRKVFIPHQKF